MAAKIECPGIDVTPVLDSRGFPLLFDLWVSGRWVGSRRTADQCAEHLTHICGLTIEAVQGNPW